MLCKPPSLSISVRKHKHTDGKEDLMYELLPKAEIYPSGCSLLCVQDCAFLNLTVLSKGTAHGFQYNLIYEQFISNFGGANTLSGPHEPHLSPHSQTNV